MITRSILFLMTCSLAAMEELPFAHESCLPVEKEATMQKLVAFVTQDHTGESDTYLVKHAWLRAYADKKELSLKTFIKAAYQDNPEAVMFLAHDYATGEFLVPHNGELAQAFKEQVATLKPSDKKWADLAVELHMQQLRALNQARSNPGYRKILAILTDVPSSLESLPAPEDALKIFYGRLASLEGQEKQEGLQLWLEGVKELNAAEAPKS